MRILKRIVAAGLALAALSGTAAEYMPVIEKTPVIVFINGQKYYIHTVKSGDTLYSIAKAYEVSEDAIKECNPGAADGLRIDQTVKIPVPEKARADARAEKKRKKEFLTHRVKAGETLFAIARDYNISVSTLREDNPNVNPQSLAIGESLWIRRAEIGSSSEAEAHGEMAEYADNLNKAADDGYVYHVVEPGETIYSLSRHFGISESEFARLNDVSDGLKAGAMIRLPKKETTTASVPAQPEKTGYGSIMDVQSSDENIIFRAVEAGRTLDVALMLPLNVDSKPNASYVEFYQGFLVGLEELKAKGRGDINLTVYNTEHNQLKVQQIVSDRSFAGTDLVVGPVYEDELKPVLQYAHANSIPVVSPLANISAVRSAALYQLSPDPERKYDKIADLIDGGRDIYLIYASSYDREFEQEMLKQLEGRSYASYNYSFDQRSILTPRNAAAPNIDDMTDILKNETPCLFVVLANSEIDVDRILGTLASANTALTERSAKSAPYTVLGTSRWGRFSNIDHTSFFNNNVVMISTYHAKRDSAAVRDFDSRYIDSFRMLPSLYAYRGYDTAMIFCEGMRSDIEYNMLDTRFAPLQTEYKFVQKQRGDKYVNQEWMRVNYNRDYTITLE